MSDDGQAGLDAALLAALERTAVHVARRAGEHALAACGAPLEVEFKAQMPGGAANSNPVSHVDREIEALVRGAIAARYPQHAVIGEETHDEIGPAGELVWVVDPIDGTTNFINGMPLFACSIGVLHAGRPVVGAIWCAATHALRPGTYHARRGGALCFDGTPLARRAPGSWRGLASEPGRAPRYGALWDTRVLGSATLECAFVAAGLLRIAFLGRPSLWDAAAGVALLHAAGCLALTHQDGAWCELRRFTPPSASGPAATLREWCQPLLVGEHAAVTAALQLRS